MRSQVRSVLLTCAFGSTLPIGGGPVQAQEATAARPADQVVVDPSLTTVRIEAFFETTDGSAQIGMVVDRIRDGRVKFQYCNGQTVDLAEKDIRRSEARCSGSGGRGKGTWTVNYEGGLGELVSGNATIPCDDLAPSLRSALATAASTPAQVGTVFSPVGPSGTSVEATSSNTTDGSASPVAQTVPAGCPAATEIMAIELTPWTASTANASLVGVYVDDMAVGAAATGQ